MLRCLQRYYYHMRIKNLFSIVRNLYALLQINNLIFYLCVSESIDTKWNFLFYTSWQFLLPSPWPALQGYASKEIAFLKPWRSSGSSVVFYIPCWIFHHTSRAAELLYSIQYTISISQGCLRSYRINASLVRTLEYFK